MIRSTVPFALLGFVVLWGAITPEIAKAQEGFPLDEPSAYRFYATPGQRRYAMTDDTEMPEHLQTSFGVVTDWAHEPFVVDEYQFKTGVADRPRGRGLLLVEGMVTTQITAAISIANLVQVGLNLPIVWNVWGDGFVWTSATSRGALQGGQATTLGDPRLHARSAFARYELESSIVLDIGAAGWVTFPVAQALTGQRYGGDPTLGFGAHGIAELSWRSLKVAVNLGFGFHDERQVLTHARTSEMTWAVAGAYDFNEQFGVYGELVGGTTFAVVVGNEAPTELRLAGVLRVSDFKFDLGAGLGIGRGVGVPVLRVFLGIGWEPHIGGDADGDGIRDERDICPADAEDRDGNADEDGCPDVDNDGDGVIDADDECPSEPEDPDGNRDEDGCPDDDEDGDGIRDGFDACPNAPEDHDGNGDDDGCPDDDRDGDGLPDGRDRCPDQAEDTDGLGDEDGCPETDFDGDGIADDQDECAAFPETRNGRSDADGCPD